MNESKKRDQLSLCIANPLVPDKTFAHSSPYQIIVNTLVSDGLSQNAYTLITDGRMGNYPNTLPRPIEPAPYYGNIVETYPISKKR